MKLIVLLSVLAEAAHTHEACAEVLAASCARAKAFCGPQSFITPCGCATPTRAGRRPSELNIIKPLAALAWQVFQVQLGGQNLTKGLAYKV